MQNNLGKAERLKLANVLLSYNNSYGVVLLQDSRIESTEVNPFSVVSSFLTVILRQWWTIIQCWNSQVSTCKRMKLDLCIAISTKMNSIQSPNFTSYILKTLCRKHGVLGLKRRLSG